MLKSRLLWAVALPLALSSMAAEAKLYKWVDEKGEVHYGEVIPPEYADKNKVQIQSGMEVQQKEKAAPGKPKAAAPTREQVEQERRDKALLATYSSEAEIDDARSRNLATVNTRIAGINDQLASAQADLNGYMKERAASKGADRVLEDQISQTNKRISRLKDELAAAQAQANSINARFDADKVRYRELTSKTPEQ